MSRDFMTEDCNGWITQVGVAKQWIHNINNAKTIPEFFGQRVAIVWVTFFITVFCLCIMLLMACLQHGKQKRHMGCLMFFWALCQVPLLDVHSLLFSAVSFDWPNTTELHFQHLQNAWWAAQQQLTICLIITIWGAIDTFKNVRMEFIEQSSVRMNLEDTQLKERKAGLIIAFLNLIFQPIMFGVVTRQTRVVTNATDVGNFTPQPFNQNYKNLAVFIGIMCAFFISVFIAVMCWQLRSLYQVIHHSIDLPIAKAALYVTIPIMSVLYINDVFAMMLFYWGSPAHVMTQFSYSMTDVMFMPVNTDPSCKSWIVDQMQSAGNEQFVLTDFGKFLQIIYTVSELTPLIWSVYLSAGFLIMQQAAFIPIHYDKRNPEKYGVVKKLGFVREDNQGNINYNNLTNSGRN